MYICIYVYMYICIYIIGPLYTQCIGYMPHNLLFGFGNKICIIEYIRQVGIAYDISTNEQQEFRNNSIEKDNYCKIHPFWYILVSP